MVSKYPTASGFCRVSLGVCTVLLLQGFLDPRTAPWGCFGVIPIRSELRPLCIIDLQRTRIAGGSVWDQLMFGRGDAASRSVGPPWMHIVLLPSDHYRGNQITLRLGQ